jgi:hypothetical protein
MVGCASALQQKKPWLRPGGDSPSAPGVGGESQPAPPVDPSRPPTSTRFDGTQPLSERPERMRSLQLPDLPLRWYPRVTPYLEQYRSEPRFARARWLVWGATRLSGAEAFSLGLAEVEAPADKVLEEARALAVRLSELPVESVRGTKRFFREQVPVPGLDALAREVYREKCEAGSAQATFTRFAPKAG